MKATRGFGVGRNLIALAVDLAGKFKVVPDIVPEVVRVNEVLPGVVGRVDINELDLARVRLL